MPLSLDVEKLKGFQLQGVSPPDRLACPWTPLRALPQTPVIGSCSALVMGPVLGSLNLKLGRGALHSTCSAIESASSSVCLSVCLSVMRLSCDYTHDILQNLFTHLIGQGLGWFVKNSTKVFVTVFLQKSVRIITVLDRYFAQSRK